MKEISKRLAGLSEKQRARLQKELLSTSPSSRPRAFEPLAIIGMACRFPGAANPAAFWDLLNRRGDAIREVPAERWAADDWYHAHPQAPGKMTMRWGGFLEGVEQFDAGFFGISPREAIDMDPQQRLVLEVAWETIEHAGLPQERLQGSRTGVFIGISTADYFLHNPPGARSVTPYVGTGSALSIAANRLSYLLDLRGPSLVIDTACSSSLVALHTGCRSLHDHDCEIALIGGVNLVLSPIWNLTFSMFGFMSPDGRCKTFDSRADGYVRGEGCGMLAVKRLSDAQTAGDSILAVIRGTAVNQDGRTASLTAPNVLAQQEVIRDALERANIAASEISYIEAHGTGTALGDPIEIEALTGVFSVPGARKESVAVGSVKSNIGHLESAAGIAGLIKVVLSLQKECIPAQVHFKKLNPNISLENTPFLIPAKSLPWPARVDQKRYAGISSFGFGGTNAHVVLEEAPDTGPEEEAPMSEASAHLLPLSARSAPALKALAKTYVDYLKTSSAPIDVLCYNASVRRSHHRHRVVLMGRDVPDLIGGLEEWIARAGSSGREETTTRRPLVFVFTGQGAQWQQMAQILEDEPVYQQTLRACDEILRRYADWSLLEQLSVAQADPSRLEQTEIAQPAICALQLALVALWKSWGIEPAAVVGHSVGEVAAAQVAGVLSLEQAMRMVYHRGRLMQAGSGQGKMAAVGLSWEEAQTAISRYGDRLSVAASNSPSSTVLSGEAGALAEVVQLLEQRAVLIRMLEVDYAFHSVQMAPYQRELEAVLEDFEPDAGGLPMISTVTGRLCGANDFDRAYWGRNIREPVRFAEAITECVRLGYRDFLEIGPHPVLTGAIGQCLEGSGADGRILASLRRDQDARASLLAALGSLYTQGHAVKWECVYPGRRRHVPLPAYPWQHQPYWKVQSHNASNQDRVAHKNSGEHPLLGRSCDIADVPQGTYHWEATIDVSSLPYLTHHVLQGASVLPISAYVELALAAAESVFGPGSHELRNMRFERILFLPQDGILNLQVALHTDSVQNANFKIYSRAAQSKDVKSSWVLHAQGSVQRKHKEQTGQSSEGKVVRPIGFSPMFFAASEDSLEGELYRLVIEAGRFADRNGFTAVWVPERHFTQFGAPYPNPAVLHAALARETQFIRLRAGSVVAPLHNPIRIAEEWAMVDNLSQGRVEVSFAAGWNPTDFALSPEKYSDRHAQLFRAVEVVKRLLRGESIEVRDGKGEPAEIRSYPTPVQVDMPVWVTAAGNPDVFARAGAIGANVLTHLLDQDIEAVAKKIALYRESLSKHGHDPQAGRVALMLHTFLGKDIDVVREQVRKPYCQYLKTIAPLLQGLAVSRGTYVNLSSLPESEQDEFINFLFERLYSTRSLLGTVESCSKLVDDLRDIGVDEIACLLDFGPSADLILQHLPYLNELKDLCNPQRAETAVVTPHCERPEVIQDRCPRETSGEEYYRRLKEQGVQDGPTFLAVEHVWQGENEALGRVRVLEELELDSYAIHPAFLAACLQVLFGAATTESQEQNASPPIPVGLKSFTVYRKSHCGARVWSHARLFPAGNSANQLEANVLIFDSDAGLIAQATGIRLQRTTPSVQQSVLSDQLSYELKWQLQPGVKPSNIRAEPGSWIIFSHVDGIGERVAELLEKEGNTCFLVFPGESRHESYRHWIPPQNSQSMDMVLSDIARQAGFPIHGVIHLWGCEAAAPGSETSIASLDASQILGVGSALNLVQSIPKKLAGHPSRLWFITRGAQPAGGTTELLAIEQSPLWGFAGVVSVELSELWGGVIDLDPSDSPVDCAARVFETVTSVDAEKQIAFRTGARYVPRFVRRHHVARDGGEIRFGEDASYLITGGLGDLGMEVARWMVRRGARHLVLLGRTGVPPRDQWQHVSRKSPIAHKIAAIESLESAGAHIFPLAVDVGNESQMASAMKAFKSSGNPPIRGVIHCAAVFDGAMLMDLDEEALNVVMRPKVHGAWILHQLFKNTPLDLFVLFSALPSVIGWVGQGAANYAAANAFLDALAHYRRKTKLPAVSIAWGPWSDLGVAARTRDGLTRLAKMGVGAIKPNQGLAVLEELIREDAVHTVIAAMDWPQFFRAFPDAANARLFSALIDDRFAQQISRQPARETWDLDREKLLTEVPEKRQQLLHSLFRERLAKILQMPANQLNSHQPLTEIGVDSLMAMELRTSIMTNLGVTVPLVRILQGPSLAELVRIVDEQIALQRPDEGPGAYTEGMLGHFSDQDVDVMLESMLDQNKGARNIE